MKKIIGLLALSLFFTFTSGIFAEEPNTDTQQVEARAQLELNREARQNQIEKNREQMQERKAPDRA